MGLRSLNLRIWNRKIKITVEERIKNIIVEELGVKPEEVIPEALFVDDLGADSLDSVELTMAMEEEFGIEILDEDAEKLDTVGKLIQYIQEKTGLKCY